MKFRSGLEERLAKSLDKQNIPYLYECQKFDYVTASKYTPDFFLPNGVVLEAKGFFAPQDRRKIKAIKEQHPDLDLRLVFQRNNLLSKKSKSTYGDWADKLGIPWCIYPNIPTDWLE